MRARKLNRQQKKKVAHTNNDNLPNSFVILGRTLRHLWRHKKHYIGIFFIYLILYIVFVKGLATNFQLSDTKELIDETFDGQLGTISTATTLFGALLGSAGSTSGEAASVYQLILFILFSLVIIYSLRSTFDDKERVGIKQAFYQCAYPLVPFTLVGLVIILQLIPALVGLSLYGIIVSNGLAVSALEQIIWLIVLLAGVGVSAYFLSSSVFAGYIVTLPKMAPVKALRSARKLVRYRRLGIIRRILFLPFAVLVFMAAIFLPLVLFLPLAAEILFMIVSLMSVFVLHAYFYTLYRELL
jgi:hypothetical protein